MRPSPAGDWFRVDGLEVVDEHEIAVADDLPRESWEAALVALELTRKGASWWIGDLAILGRERWGVSYDEIARLTGRAPHTVQRGASIARAFPLRVRRRWPGVSWRSCRELLKLKPFDRLKWMARAHKNGWTSEELRAELLRLSKGGKGGGGRGGRSIPRCSRCGRECPHCAEERGR